MIRCDQCGAENRDQAQHCIRCGALLPSRGALMPGAVSSLDRQVGLPIASSILGVICLVYLLNPTAGVIELIPDNLPIVGNLDEGVAGMMLLQALNSLRQFVSMRRGGRGKAS